MKFLGLLIIGCFLLIYGVDAQEPTITQPANPTSTINGNIPPLPPVPESSVPLTTTTPDKPIATEPPKPFEDRVIARIDGESIMLSEVEKSVDRFEAKFQEINPQMKLGEDKRVKMRKEQLDRLIKDKILEKAAAQKKYAVTDAEIDERINQLQKLFGPGDDARQKFLGGIKDMNEFRSNIARQIKIDRYMDEAAKEDAITVSDAEIESYYKANPDKFKEEESVHVRQILWRLPPVESPDYQGKRKSAFEKADEVIKSVSSGGDFGELAKKMNEDKTSAENGGDLGWISRKKMVKAFEDAAFSLKPGEISKPVETNFGIHLIQLIERKDARSKSLEESKAGIREFLERQKKGNLKEQLYNNLKSKAKIEILL